MTGSAFLDALAWVLALWTAVGLLVALALGRAIKVCGR